MQNNGENKFSTKKKLIAQRVKIVKKKCVSRERGPNRENRSEWQKKYREKKKKAEK